MVENSIPERLFEPPQLARSGNVVTFVGTLNHPPNTDAVEWLVREIWPLVISKRPDAELRVAGRSDGGINGPITRRLGALVREAGGRLDVDVDDIRPLYWEAAVVVAPIRTGAGMRSKVIHAMACGAPVVATITAFEGIPETATRQAMTGTTAAEVAAGIVKTLDDPAGACAAPAPRPRRSRRYGCRRWPTGSKRGGSRSPACRASPPARGSLSPGRSSRARRRGASRCPAR